METVLPESVQTLHLSGPLSLHEWQQLFELAPFGIGVFDREFRCRGVNGIFTELSGLAQGDHLGKTLYDITPAQAPLLRPRLQQWLSGAPQAELDLGYVHVSRPGRPRHWQMSCSPLMDVEGIFNGIFLIARELTQAPCLHQGTTRCPGEIQEASSQHAQRLNQAETRLHHLSYHDPLTDLGNRNLLQERLALEIETAQLNRQSLALLFIDLDGFKLINGCQTTGTAGSCAAP